MLIRKQPPPPVMDTDHADYYADTSGNAHFVVDAVNLPVHDGDPVPLTASGGDPTTLPDEVQLYTKDMAGPNTELFVKNGAGDVAQVTSGGALTSPPGNNVFFAGRQFRAEFDVEVVMPTGVFPPPFTQPVVLIDLGQTLTIPDEGDGDWCLVQERWSYKVAVINPASAVEAVQQVSSMVLNDNAGDVIARFAALNLGFYTGGPSLGYALFVIPYSLIPASLLAPPYFPYTGNTDPDRAVAIVFSFPVVTIRFTGLVDVAVFTIPNAFP